MGSVTPLTNSTLADLASKVSSTTEKTTVSKTKADLIAPHKPLEEIQPTSRHDPFVRLQISLPSLSPANTILAYFRCSINTPGTPLVNFLSPSERVIYEHQSLQPKISNEKKNDLESTKTSDAL